MIENDKKNKNGTLTATYLIKCQEIDSLKYLLNSIRRFYFSRIELICEYIKEYFHLVKFMVKVQLKLHRCLKSYFSVVFLSSFFVRCAHYGQTISMSIVKKEEKKMKKMKEI